jgi:hypothetical protein
MRTSAPLLQLEKPGGFVAIDESLLTGQAGMCDLFVLFTPSSASLALRERLTRRFIAAETLLAGDEPNESGPAFIREVLKRSQVFRLNAHRKTTVAVSHPFISLLPSGLIRTGDENSLLRFTVSRNDLIALSTMVSGFDLQVVFGLPPEEESLIRQLIPGCSITHSIAAALEHGKLAGTPRSMALRVIAHPGILSVVGLSGKKLSFANVFPVADTEEAVYHLLNVAEQLEADRNSLPLQLEGSASACDALMERLAIFFSNVRLADTRIFPLLSNKLKELPAASILPILTVSLCES